MGIRRVGLASVVLAVMLLASSILAGTAAAGVIVILYQPDGWVQYRAFHSPSDVYLEPTPWKGDDIYNLTGQQQTSKQMAGGVYDDGAYYVFQATIQNDGEPDRFRVKATGTGDWTVKYYRGTTNITSAVVNGTYQTEMLENDETVVLKIKVWIGDPGTSVTRKIKFTSVANPEKRDVVRVKASYTACGC